MVADVTSYKLVSNANIFDNNVSASPFMAIESSAHTIVIKWPFADATTEILPWLSGLKLVNRAFGCIEEVSIKDGFYLDVFEEDNPLFESWLTTIPAALLEVTKGFSHNRLPILQLAAQHRVVADILKSTPILMLLWYSYCRSNGMSEHQCINALDRPQVKLLSLMRLVPKKSIIYFLRKLNFESYGQGQLDKITSFCANVENVTYIGHLRRVNQTAFWVIQSVPFLIGSKMIDLLIEANSISPIPFGFICNIHRAVALGGQLSIRHIRNMNSVEQLNRYCEKCINVEPLQNVEALTDDSGEHLPLKQSPLIGNEVVQPIVSVDEVIETAKKMRNCLADYIIKMQRGSYFCFHINTEPKFVLGLAYNPKIDAYSIDQIKGFQNVGPPQKIEDFVHEWLRIQIMYKSYLQENSVSVLPNLTHFNKEECV
jgi:hypothetical protein